jgi:hypothetical protein
VSDPGLLRVCFRVLATWLSVRLPSHRAHILYGLPHREKAQLFDSALIFLANPPMGTANLHRDMLTRIQKLPTDVYHGLQAEYYALLLRLYTGDAEGAVGEDLAGALTFSRQMEKLAERRSGASAVCVRP